jgi:nucleotide-binding universal stress UspA family protein
MFKKALVPLDGSEMAECALNHVKTLIKDGSIGEATLLNVVNINISWTETGYSNYGTAIDEIRDEILFSAKKYLAEVESQFDSEGIKVKTEVLKTTMPAHAIAEYADKESMDVIVVATHGYTGFKKMMLGSVAFGVLNQSHVPVLLIRPESCQE